MFTAKSILYINAAAEAESPNRVNTKKSIIFVAPIHRPFGNRVVREAEQAAKSNFSITVICKTEKEFTQNGVLYKPALKSRRFLHRLINLPIIYRQIRKLNGDIYHLHNPDTLPIAFWLKRKNHFVIYDTHEDFSKRLELRSWIPAPFKKSIAKIIVSLEKKAAQKFNAVLVTQANLKEKYGGNTVLLRNFPSKTLLTNSNPVRRDPKILRFVYVGTISQARCIEEMVELIDKVNEFHPARLWLIGPENDNCLETVQFKSGWKYVDYLGIQPHENCINHMAGSDIALLMLKDQGDHATAVPTKLFEYMSCDLPIIATKFPAWVNDVNENSSVFWVEQNDNKTALDAVEKILNSQNMAERFQANKEILKTKNWEAEFEKLLAIYNPGSN